ncbi:MAG: hypothetical protein PHN35_03550, partial [Clostridia bacterium]|nr:hypothetical protein [Clostridia bacterium]
MAASYRTVLLYFFYLILLNFLINIFIILIYTGGEIMQRPIDTNSLLITQKSLDVLWMKQK